MRGSALSAYTQNSINIESPIKLVEMLFEGILKFTAQAKKSMLDDDIEKQVYWINRTIDIFSELISSLDYSGEQKNLAEYLNGLYTYQIKLLTEANIECEPQKLDIVMNVARGLIEAWKEETSKSA
ncbi:MAG: flagellar secretion chaperone FliS [Campylobacterota bacterium]|nr:flagellar secretion chaperone FliS [Campylobacterota bacterium]